MRSAHAPEEVHKKDKNKLTDSSGAQPLREDCSTRLLVRREFCARGATKAEADARTQRMTASLDMVRTFCTLADSVEEHSEHSELAELAAESSRLVPQGLLAAKPRLQSVKPGGMKVSVLCPDPGATRPRRPRRPARGRRAGARG